MYTQAMDTMAREGAPKLEKVLSADEQALQGRFDARIDAGIALIQHNSFEHVRL